MSLIFHLQQTADYHHIYLNSNLNKKQHNIILQHKNQNKCKILECSCSWIVACSFHKSKREGSSLEQDEMQHQMILELSPLQLFFITINIVLLKRCKDNLRRMEKLSKTGIRSEKIIQRYMTKQIYEVNATIQKYYDCLFFYKISCLSNPRYQTKKVSLNFPTSNLITPQFLSQVFLFFFVP